MTDKEVIKALECCGKNHITGSADACEHCFLQNNAMCVTELIYKALDLINRQQAEIEQWKEEANRYQTLWCEDVQTAKTKAIKEFAEKVKADINKTWYYELEKDTHNARALRRVDELVKEMVGEGK